MEKDSDRERRNNQLACHRKYDLAYLEILVQVLDERLNLFVGPLLRDRGVVFPATGYGGQGGLAHERVQLLERLLGHRLNVASLRRRL